MTKLLLIEDDRESRIRIEACLRKAGYEVDAVASFDAAMRYMIPLQGEAAAYAAVLSDYNLGSRMTGLNVFQAVWRQFRPCPPFIATSSEMDKWEEAKDVFNLHLVPKLHHRWDEAAILAKLLELSITA